MSENSQKVVKYNVVKEIISQYDPELLKWLKANNYKYRIHEIKDLTPYQSKKEINEEFPLIEVDPELYQKLKKLSQITGIPIKNIVSKELGDFFFSVGDIPVIFLDCHLGIENIEKPIEMIKNLKDVIHIPERYLESLKTKDDLLKELEEWNHPLKNIIKPNK